MALNPAAALVAAMVALALAAAAAADKRPPIGLPGCDTRCGKVNVPYPFGFGPPHCYWPGLNLTCDKSGHGGEPRLLLGDGTLRVVDISLKNTSVRVIRTGSIINSTAIIHDVNAPFGDSFMPYGYRLSASNELVLTGCNVMAMLVGDGDGKPGSISGGCVSFCSDREPAFGYIGRRAGKYCSGAHCCQMAVDDSPYSAPTGLQVRWLNGRSNDDDRNSVPVYVFVAEEGWFDQRPVADDLIGRMTDHPSKASFEVPLLLRWAVAEDLAAHDWLKYDSQHCEPSVASKLCKSDHTKCSVPDAANITGYVCLCQEGYDGNPYLLTGAGGCQEISMNATGHRTTGALATVPTRPGRSSASVVEEPAATPGCPTAAFQFQLQPSPKACHLRCHSNCLDEFSNKVAIVGIAVGSGAGSILLVLIAIFMTQRLNHLRATKLKQKYFKQNRGQLLQQLVSQNVDIAERMIIPVDELAKATNNFDKARELGGGGHGTVYKGILSDQHVVAIKKSKITVQREIDEFINEVVILSQINHRNVVKLFGCCLETEVPLLVYEFVSNGTLYEHLHVEGLRSLSWNNRLRIATEAASALSYLHSSVSIPIIHRDIKSTNILLDDMLTSKVSDFGASRYIPTDKTGLTTMVQGTIGYLDPLYFYTCRLTEKSDVYSFGVILIELLTRKKPFSYMFSEGEGLVAHFVKLLIEDNLVEILDPQVKEEGGEEVQEVAKLAALCTNVNSEDRPTMREVEHKLQGLQASKKSVTDNMRAQKIEEDGSSLMDRSSNKEK
ncbi:hypothetical protein ACP4OV_025620 [Aristida adscensionis]